MKLLDLDTLSKLPPDQQIEIKKGIIETNALEDITIAYLPDVHTSDYYFVSYSHLDYVDVYCDIFELHSMAYLFGTIGVSLLGETGKIQRANI